jgi:hypothetical protein
MMKNTTGINFSQAKRIGLDINSHMMIECHPMMKQAPAHFSNTNRQQYKNAGCTSAMAAESRNRALGVCNITEK